MVYTVCITFKGLHRKAQELRRIGAGRDFPSTHEREQLPRRQAEGAAGHLRAVDYPAVHRLCGNEA